MSGQSVYWYAPFDNASEMALAAELAPRLRASLVVETVHSRFGVALPIRGNDPFRLVRDLPPPRGEDCGVHAGLRSSWRIARDRAARRRTLVKAIRPSLVHLHTYNITTDWYDAWRLRRAGAPVIQSIHNVRPQDQRLPGFAETALLSAGYRAFDRLIVAHSHLADRLSNEFGVDEKKIEIVPLPLVSGDFQSGNQAGRPSGGPTTFLFFGTMRANKGLDVYLKAIESLRGNGSLRFVFAGRGDAKLESRLSEQTKVDDRIVVELGYVSSKRRSELYSTADIVVMPYTDLPAQSGVLRDAYSSGRAVVATDVGALGPAVREDGTGWIARPGSVGSLVQALKQAAESPSEQAKCAARARELVQVRSASKIAEQLLEVYERAAGSKLTGPTR